MNVYDFAVKAILKGILLPSSRVHQSYWGSGVILRLKPNKILNNNYNARGFKETTMNNQLNYCHNIYWFQLSFNFNMHYEYKFNFILLKRIIPSHIQMKHAQFKSKYIYNVVYIILFDTKLHFFKLHFVFKIKIM